MVALDQQTSGPLRALQVGDPVEVYFEVHLPPNIISPGTEHEYEVDRISFRVTSNGSPLPGQPSLPATLVVENANPINDAVHLSTPINIGQLFQVSTVLPSTIFHTADLTQLEGFYDVGILYLSRQMIFTGFGGYMELDLEGLEITFIGLAQSFCGPQNNSTGMPCLLNATANSGVGSGVHLDAIQGPPLSFAYFLVGNGDPNPGLSISQGVLCLAGAPSAIGRYNLAGTQFNSLGQFKPNGRLHNLSGTSQSGSGFDIPSLAPISGSPAILAGQTWHFQLWYRDNGTQSNFSDGLSIHF